MFGRLERYIFRQASGAFLICMGALTVVVWLTLALRELDLLTLKGQTLVVFLTLTALILPSLIMVIAPIALFIAIVYTLNRLNSDSELVVMSASGVSRMRMAQPFLALSLIVALLCAVISLHLSPLAMQGFRSMITEVRADIISTVLRDGAFTDAADGLTFHVRDRQEDGSLNGLLVSDTRDEERDFSYIAESGKILETPAGTYLVMLNGNVQRRDKPRGSVTVIAFEQYALDLSQFSPEQEATFYKPKERSTVDLLFPSAEDLADPMLAPNIRGEIHERLVSPLYPISFTLLALAFLGKARTNRQSRWAALLAAVVCVGLVRLAGFGAISLAVRSPVFVPLVYALPLGAVVLALFMIRTGHRALPFRGWPDRIAAALGTFGGAASQRPSP